MNTQLILKILMVIAFQIVPILIIGIVNEIGKKKYNRRIDGTFEHKVRVRNMDGSIEFFYM